MSMNAAMYESFGGPIRITKIPIPTLPSNDAQDDSVLVQVQATGVCRSDWHGWKGHDSDIRQHGLPFVPGHEFSGIVVQVTSAVRSCRVGDRVVAPFLLSCGSCRYCSDTTSDGDDEHGGGRRQWRSQPTICRDQQQPGFTYFGSFAEYVVVRRANRHVCVLPEVVTFVQAAALGCRFTTAYRALCQQGKLAPMPHHPMDSLVVIGCGGVGLSCILLASALRLTARIVAVDVSTAALSKAKELGASHTVALEVSDTSADAAHREAVLQCADPEGDGADVCIDAAGTTLSCALAVACTRPGGRMVQVGLPHHPVSIPMARIAAKEIEIVGSHGFTTTDLAQLLTMVAQGVFDPARMVDKQVSLEEGIVALAGMDQGSPLGITTITQF